jgi:hypothetical protein
LPSSGHGDGLLGLLVDLVQPSTEPATVMAKRENSLSSDADTTRDSMLALRQANACAGPAGTPGVSAGLCPAPTSSSPARHGWNRVGPPRGAPQRSWMYRGYGAGARLRPWTVGPGPTAPRPSRLGVDDLRPDLMALDGAEGARCRLTPGWIVPAPGSTLYEG